MIEIQPNLKNRNANITVIGIGGGGNNAIDRMIASNVAGIEFIAVNTDIQVLDANSAPTKIQIGVKLTEGLGAGADPEIGAKSAEENLTDIVECLTNTQIVFLTAGMGGGTGTGAIPVIAKACHDMGILTVAVVTKPFTFEGLPRMQNAENGIAQLKEYADTLLIIPNDKLLERSDKSFYIQEAFQECDEVLHQGVTGIAQIILERGLINLDFKDINTVMRAKGLAHLGIGISKGTNSIMNALNNALNSPLLETSIEGATHILFNCTGQIDLIELDTAAKSIRDIAGENVNILWGTVGTSSSDDEICVTIIATGMQPKAKAPVKPSIKPFQFKQTINQPESNTKIKEQSNSSIMIPEFLLERTRSH